MKAIEISGIQEVTLIDKDKPVITSPDDVIVKVKAVSICGTDVHTFQGEHPFVKPPVVVGHDLAHALGSRDEVVLLVDVDDGESGGAGQRIAGFLGDGPQEANGLGGRRIYFDLTSSRLAPLNVDDTTASELQPDFDVATTAEARELIAYARGLDIDDLDDAEIVSGLLCSLANERFRANKDRTNEPVLRRQQGPTEKADDRRDEQHDHDRGCAGPGRGVRHFPAIVADDGACSALC